MTLLRVNQVHKIYPSGTHALKGVSFEVEKGEFLVIIGLSGSGKSTLLRCINRLHEPTSGNIQFNGRDITHVKGKELRQLKRQIGMVFQQFNLIKRRSVLVNVLTGALGRMGTFQSLTENFPQKLVDEAMEALKTVGIEEKAHIRADALSGGQQQRVAIARSLMQHPDLLLADEPVASLDPATSNSVMQYFEKINKKFGTTVICNLHFLSLVRKYATRVIALKAGEIIYEGLPEDIDDDWFKTIYGEEAEEVEIR
ncbi:MAG: phosphonate ABC transporter ATP-binding protein [Ignavibacteriales bacterium]|nr:MAG: phosphonate ABC transporter ATP-binding protein [Ignavibacteriaceae bacterium]MBW7873614.1 phosphonate ABC transporter ATP-binding protein [Ignavibacteria bacterium]MCZ2143844.1 phosphonate ABC transporter ATP-binding protein [Ignavibacteriales bacterium]OQY75760.1 MAG: phosphonate ABC transporter ATP-binding protein [Ignavibacteriales bacterium UTCHB3]MBV6445885.1 Phosphate-import ATP-binding protein PhnC [Ignavibacteriaceae bacterium]